MKFLEDEEKSFFVKFFVPLIAGGIAGTTADLVLFPLDTVKTRLQSTKGFLAAGGFQKIYAGILPAAAGSAPSAAVFFCTYELTNIFFGRDVPKSYMPLIHMFAATAGEVTCNIVRVPFEVVKQRSQANRHLRPYHILMATLTTEGPRGLYRGYVSTIIRDIPFSFIQYPLWEYLKSSWSNWQGYPTHPWQAAVCGTVAGGTAAAITTPLDVAKTRIMLAMSKDMEEVQLSLPRLVMKIGREEGIRRLFSGILPRLTWIGLGGFFFLGAYDFSKQRLLKFHERIS